MPQITSNFIFRSKLPNFERDSFNSLRAMWEVDSSWIDEGHISFCKEDGNHYIFNSQNGTLFGEARWKKVIEYYQNDVVDLVKSDFVHKVDTLSELLRDGLATSLSLGRLVYVKENNTIYYNTYDSSLTEQSTIYLEGETGWFRPLGPNVDNFVTKTELNDYVKKDELPSIPEYSGVTEERVNELIDEKTGHLADDVVNASNAAAAVSRDLNDYKTLADQKFASKTYSDSTYATKTGVLDSVTGLNNRIAELNTEIDALKDLDHSVFLTKEEASTTYSTIEQVEELDGKVGLDILSVRSDLEQTNDNIKGTQDDLEKFKTYVEETYDKPDDIAGRLNNYKPIGTNNDDTWIANEASGSLVGFTGEQLNKMNMSYNEVFDNIFFKRFVPTVSNPSVNVKFVDDVQVDWYDENNRILLVEDGALGYDAGSFTHTNAKDAVIDYPENAPVDVRKYTNGVLRSEAFCKEYKDGNWEYTGKDGDIYHVPVTLHSGEYRYHIAAYFEGTGPVLDNIGNIVPDYPGWKGTPVESKDYITVNVSKPVYYNTKNGIVKAPLMLWTDKMEQCIELLPSGVISQSFSLPRQLQELYIWNDLAGDYARVPTGGFLEEIDENGYYTYMYDSSSNGHRGGIKIKVVF